MGTAVAVIMAPQASSIVGKHRSITTKPKISRQSKTQSLEPINSRSQSYYDDAEEDDGFVFTRKARNSSSIAPILSGSRHLDTLNESPMPFKATKALKSSSTTTSITKNPLRSRRISMEDLLEEDGNEELDPDGSDREMLRLPQKSKKRTAIPLETTVKKTKTTHENTHIPETIQEPLTNGHVKRGRGRPRKVVTSDPDGVEAPKTKRGRKPAAQLEPSHPRDQDEETLPPGQLSPAQPKKRKKYKSVVMKRNPKGKTPVKATPQSSIARNTKLLTVGEISPNIYEEDDNDKHINHTEMSNLNNQSRNQQYSSMNSKKSNSSKAPSQRQTQGQDHDRISNADKARLAQSQVTNPFEKRPLLHTDDLRPHDSTYRQVSGLNGSDTRPLRQQTHLELMYQENRVQQEPQRHWGYSGGRLPVRSDPLQRQESYGKDRRLLQQQKRQPKQDIQSKTSSSSSSYNKVSQTRPQSVQNLTESDPTHISEPQPTSPLTPPHSHDVSSTTQISLPISDTPVIRRNQEMRRQQEKMSGRRRSSLNQRGKRTSSVGNGFKAVPHESIDPSTFYKHLDPELPEPHRLKQLLVWSSRRILDNQEQEYTEKNVDSRLSTEDRTAWRIARLIQEEVARDLSDGKISVSWWNRKEEEEGQERIRREKEGLTAESESNENAKQTKILRPNIQNVINLQNLQAYERKLKALQQEKDMWAQELLQIEKLSEDSKKLEHEMQTDKNKLEKIGTKVRANHGANQNEFDEAILDSLRKYGDKGVNGNSSESQNMLADLYQRHPVLVNGIGSTATSSSAVETTVTNNVEAMTQGINKLVDFGHKVDAVSRAAIAYSQSSMKTVGYELEREREMEEYQRIKRLEAVYKKSKPGLGSDSDDESENNTDGKEDEEARKRMAARERLMVKNSQLATLMMDYLQNRREKQRLQNPSSKNGESSADGSERVDSLSELALQQDKQPALRDILRAITRLEKVPDPSSPQDSS